jgi:hypothetical protein
MMSSTITKFLSFRVISILGNRIRLEGIDQANRVAVVGQEWNALPETLESTMLYVLVNSKDGGPTFLQSINFLQAPSLICIIISK